MMRVYIGFDDTDVTDSPRGTGKLARWFEKELPGSCAVWGVLRQQLLVDQAIPYTSHNSSACVVVECLDLSCIEELTARAVSHIEFHFIEGSDPGLCVCPEGHPVLDRLVSFGLQCTARVMTQQDAMDAAEGVRLSGHGGTNDGIIGAAAAVGLTVRGWSGRFIEYGRLRGFPDPVPVEMLVQSGMEVISFDRDAMAPRADDTVETKGWLRPRLLGGKAVVPVIPLSEKRWAAIGGKRPKGKKEGVSNGREDLLQGTDKGW